MNNFKNNIFDRKVGNIGNVGNIGCDNRRMIIYELNKFIKNKEKQKEKERLRCSIL